MLPKEYTLCVRCLASPISRAEQSNHLHITAWDKTAFDCEEPVQIQFSLSFTFWGINFGFFLILQLVIPSLSLCPTTDTLPACPLSIQRSISLWSAIYYQTIIQTDKLHPQSVGASHARKVVVQKRWSTLSTRCFLLASGKYFPLLELLLAHL